MNPWHDINPKRISPCDFLAVIEISKGSKNKYELDKETGLLILDRILYTSHIIRLITDLFQELMAKTLIRWMYLSYAPKRSLR